MRREAAMDSRDIATGVGLLMLKGMSIVAAVCLATGVLIGWALS